MTSVKTALEMAIDFLDGSYEAHKIRKACQEALASHSDALESQEQDPVSVSLKFPTMLRKMWSGAEVQDWLNKQRPLYTHPCKDCHK